MNDRTDEVILAEVLAELDDLGVRGNRNFDDVPWPRKAIFATKLRELEEQVGDLLAWLPEHVPEGVDPLSLVELEMEVTARQERQ